MTVLSKFQSFWIAELLCWQRCVSIVTFQGQVCENSPSPAWPIGPIAPCDKQQQTTEIFLQLIIIKSQITSLIYHYYVYEYRQTEQDLYIYLFIYSFMKGQINPTPVGGGRFPPPYQKMAITPRNNDPKEPNFCDFSYISMTNLPMLFLGLKMAKRGFSIGF